MFDLFEDVVKLTDSDLATKCEATGKFAGAIFKKRPDEDDLNIVQRYKLIGECHLLSPDR